jgi:DNA-binding FadR family transcriptional regulator
LDAKLKTARNAVNLKFPLEFNSPLPTGAAKKAVEILGARIINDVYAPDEFMPTEAELAESLAVSRATVRDAVKVLSGKGLVRTARRYGTRVMPVSEWNLLDGDVVAWHDPAHPRIKRMFSETTELRTILEPSAAALAAERASPEQVRIILDAAQAMHPEDGDLQPLFAADCQFHITLLEATQNNVMKQMRQIILSMLRISYEIGIITMDDEDVSREGHIEVAEAIRARKPDAARKAMQRMLERNERAAANYWANW